MIKIEAIVRPERINSVTQALEEAGCGGFHYQNITGQGRQGGVEVFTGRGGNMAKAAGPKTLLVTVIPDGMRDSVIEASVESAKGPDGGQIGDGKIFVSPVSNAIRIRTGEDGDAAI